MIDNLRRRADGAVDEQLAGDLHRQADFLEAQMSRYEEVVAGIAQGNDPRLIARMTQETNKAIHEKGFMPFDEAKVPGVDPENYWYVANEAAPPPYRVFHKSGTTPRLMLTPDANHGSGYRLVEDLRHKSVHTFAAGTSKADALQWLLKPGKSFGPYRQMLLDHKLATDNEILGAMMAPGGVTEDVLRLHLKKAFRQRVLDHMIYANPTNKTLLSAAESTQRFQTMTKGLNSADYGSLGESWYAMYNKAFGKGDNTLEAHPRFFDEDGGKRLPDFVERNLDGNTVVEVKSTREGLSDRDVEQIRQSLKLVEEEGGSVTTKGGESLEIDGFRLVFTQQDGAAKSLDDIEDLYDAFDEVDFKVEVFLASGSDVFSDMKSLRDALR